MKRVLLGMSGGVDSSVAAYLLKKDGYEVVGITMNLLNDEQNVNDAKKVCDYLGIEHHAINFSDYFKSHVIDNFINCYKNALTPNPCVECNKYLKFGLLVDKMKELKCDYIATGHYAKIDKGKLCKINSVKDQSYFLYKINKEVLKHIIFPLNSYLDKSEIRSIASQVGLPTANKKDSQDICFIKDENYATFLEENLDKLPDKGNFVLESGKVIGRHKGLIYYTVGQRKGLGISYSTPLYVIAIDKEKNQIVLGPKESLYSKNIEITDINLLVDEWPNKASGKIRYKAKLVPCTIEKIDDNNLKIVFDESVRAATPGQALVLYDNDVCLGGGTISKIYK